MKTRLIACLSFVAILAAGFSVSLINSSKNVKKVEGYSTSSLPTTIDLNDSTANDIRSYYSSLNNKTQSERQGTNLLKNLKPFLKMVKNIMRMMIVALFVKYMRLPIGTGKNLLLVALHMVHIIPLLKKLQIILMELARLVVKIIHIFMLYISIEMSLTK